MRAADKTPPMALRALAQPLVNELHAEAHRLWKAAQVIRRDPRISAWLRENDPKAWEQLARAVQEEA